MKKVDVKQISSLIATIEYLRKSGVPGFSKKFLVTPDDAMYMLDQYEWKNRNISEDKVMSLATLIRRGEYVPCNGETLKFGRIAEEKNRPIRMDGGHRLWAIAEAGLSIELEFYFYDPYSLEYNTVIWKSLDNNRPRKTCDILNFNEVKDATLTLSIVRILIRTYELHHPFIGYNVSRHNHLITSKMCEDFLNKYNDEILQTVKMTNKVKKAGFNKPAVIGALYYHYRFVLKNQDADKFIEDICSGANLANKSVELALTNYLRLFNGDTRYKTSKITEVERNIACNMAFEHFHNKPKASFVGFTSKRLIDWLNRHNIVIDKRFSFLTV